MRPNTRILLFRAASALNNSFSVLPAEMPRNCRVFKETEGFEGRRNTVLYAHSKYPQSQKFLVFFGGDTQDLEICMKNRCSNVYIPWSLENTIEILSDRFPKHHVLIVAPSRISATHGIAFSCFDNFVPGNEYGVPTFCTTYNAWKHLQMLINSALTKIDSAEQEKRVNCDIDDINFTLMGFSKGCVVLNQLLHEIPSILNGASVRGKEYSFLHQIKCMWWLDSGHSGYKCAWITDKHMLEAFAKLNIHVEVHVTPYQIQDVCRPWICEEEKYFTRTLKQIGVSVNRQMHFGNYPRSLSFHFNILKDIHDSTREDVPNP